MVANGKSSTNIDFLLFDPFRYEALVSGQQEFAAEYRENLYFLADNEAREKFMRLICSFSPPSIDRSFSS